MLGAIERGDRNPSLKLAKKIADYYGVSVDEIFFDEMDTNCVRNGKEDKEHAQTQAGCSGRCEKSRRNSKPQRR